MGLFKNIGSKIKGAFKGVGSKVKGGMSKVFSSKGTKPLTDLSQKGLLGGFFGAFGNMGKSWKQGKGLGGKVKGLFKSYGSGMKSMFNKAKGLAGNVAGKFGIDLPFGQEEMSTRDGIQDMPQGGGFDVKKLALPVLGIVGLFIGFKMLKS